MPLTSTCTAGAAIQGHVLIMSWPRCAVAAYHKEYAMEPCRPHVDAEDASLQHTGKLRYLPRYSTNDRPARMEVQGRWHAGICSIAKPTMPPARDAISCHSSLQEWRTMCRDLPKASLCWQPPMRNTSTTKHQTHEQSGYVQHDLAQTQVQPHVLSVSASTTCFPTMADVTNSSHPAATNFVSCCYVHSLWTYHIEVTCTIQFPQ